MNPRRSFYRKIAFLAVMVALLAPMHFIGQPATRGSQEAGGSQGKLARLRQENGLSQSNLGEIDPASETMKLATLGLDNLAVSILWSKSEQYKVKHDWDKLSVTLNQITKLQPNFVSVWKYQGWNLSYNVSVEWDDYKDRYLWVKKGIYFLKEGTQHNNRETRLLTDIGWFTSSKIGRADEARAFRRLFRADGDFHRAMPYGNTDNWLAGGEWHLRAEELVSDGAVTIKGTSPTLFYVAAPMCRIHYASDLEVDGGPDGRGVYGPAAKQAWSEALKSWLAYSDKPLVNTSGVEVVMSRFDYFNDEIVRLTAAIEALDPDLRDRLKAERIAALKPEDREFVLGPPPGDDRALRYIEMQTKLQLNPTDLVAGLTGEKKAQGQKLVDEMSKYGGMLQAIIRQRNLINHEVWERRCRFEMTDEAVDARMYIAKAEEADQIETNLRKAKEAYAQAFDQWNQVFEKFPDLRTEDLTIGPLILSIDRYIVILKELNEELPQDFVLKDLLEQAEKNPSLRH